MSFIYDDKKLIESLVKAGIQYEKQAQRYVPPAARDVPAAGPQPNLTPEQAASYKLAKKMVMDLLEQVNPNDPDVAKKPVPLSSATGGEVEIKPDNLKDLGDFIQWASTVRWKGKPVAWLTEEAAPKEGDVWTFRAYSQDRSDRDPATRKVNRFMVYADKPALLEMLAYLRDSKEAKTEKPYQVQLSKIIGQINEYLEKNEQVKDRADTGVAAGALDPNAVVDGFPGDTFDMATKYEGTDKQPNFEGMPVPLLVKHISSRDALVGWLNNMKVKTNAGVVPVLKAEVGDPCIAIHIMYLRAKYLAGIAVDTEKKPYKKIANLYLTNIQNFGKTFENANGPCTVTQPTGAPAAAGADRGSGAGAGGTADAAQLDKVLDALPLDNSDIDFRRISAFFDTYYNFASAGARKEITDAKATMNTILNGGGQWGPIVKNQKQSFSMNVYIDQVATWLNNVQSVMSFLAGMDSIMRNVQTVLEDLHYQYGNKIKGDNLSRLRGQFVIWSNNQGVLSKWRGNANQILKV